MSERSLVCLVLILLATVVAEGSTRLDVLDYAATLEVETYRANYEKVRAAGKDKSLVFPTG